MELSASAPELLPNGVSEPPAMGSSGGYHRWIRRGATIALALATVAIAALMAVWFFDLSLEDRPTRIVRAYATEHRQTDLRFPGAGYSPVRSLRGLRQDYDFSAAELADLEEETKAQLARNPGDSQALFTMAQICLLRMQPLQAIDILERLRLFAPKDGELLGALAYAHYLRGRMTHETPDLLRSVDLFEKALEARPDDPVLLFNAATAAQRAELRAQAKSRYERFLTLESGTGWAVEARIRLREVAPPSR